MPAHYQSLRDRAVKAVDSVFAEAVDIVAVDSDRRATGAPVTVTGVLRSAAQVAASMAGGRGQSWNIEVAAGSAMLSVDRARYPGLVVSPGDRVKAVSRPGEPWFEVARVDHHDLSRLIIHLSEG